MGRWLLPWVLAMPGWWFMVRALRRGARGQALTVAACWALLLTVSLGAWEWHRPGTCGRLFPGAELYAQGMLTWVKTGIGCEGDPTCFVWQHFWHLVVFAASTAVSGGLAGLAFGAGLLGWMGAYTGALAQHTGNPLALLWGWHPWAVLRVVGYLILGVTLSEGLARRGLPALPGRSPWLLRGLAFWVADLALKWLLAEWWRLQVLQTL